MLRNSWPLSFMKKRADAAAGHIYWRLQIDSNNDNSTAFTCLVALDMRTSIGGSNVATGGTAFSGGSGADVGGSEAAKAFDGSTSTEWARTSATNTIIGYQFASPVNIVEIAMSGTRTGTINGFGAQRSPLKGRLQYSDDGTTYTTVFEFYERSWNASGATRVWPQTPAAGQYKMFRISFTAVNGGNFTMMQEVQMLDALGGSDQCNGGAAFAIVNTTNQEAWRAFDNVDGLPYAASTTGQLPGYMGYAFPLPVAVPQYTIRCTADSGGSNARTPNTFKLQGSNDFVTWTDLDSRSGITWAIPETKTFTV